MKYGIFLEDEKFVVKKKSGISPVGAALGSDVDRRVAEVQLQALQTRDFRALKARGNFGHRGRKGQRGGSASNDTFGMSDAQQIAREEGQGAQSSETRTDQEIKEILSKYLYSIDDVALQGVVRNIIFTMSPKLNWQEIYAKMKELMPELIVSERSAFKPSSPTRSLESDDDLLLSMGSSLKALGGGRIGGHLVLYGKPDLKDFYGDYFTSETYLGPADANGRDVTINHRLPIKTGVPDFDEVMTRFTQKIFKPGGLKTFRDDLGIFGEVICDLSDAYDAMVYRLAEQGKLKWSGGAARHMIDRAPDGQLKMFVLAEAALTPAPAEPRMITSRVVPLKTLMAEFDVDLKAREKAKS